jgi:hypothetical protein
MRRKRRRGEEEEEEKKEIHYEKEEEEGTIITGCRHARYEVGALDVSCLAGDL